MTQEHIKKVMFLAAVARPRCLDRRTETWFDGKICILPFTERYTTVRRSKNRPAGEEVLRTVAANKESMRQLTILVGNKIHKLWPTEDIGKTIHIQMDNASPHVTEDDPEWIEAKQRWPQFNIVLVRQPPQSPDTNVLDLGLWNSVQSIQKKRTPMMINARTELELVRAVKHAWHDMPMETVASAWVTLTNVLREIRDNDGGNRFKTPRKRKYASMIERGDYSVDEHDDDEETETEPEPDSDCDLETKPKALRGHNYDAKADGITAAAI